MGRGQIYRGSCKCTPGRECHRRSQGVQWVHLHPRAVKKIRRNLQGKFLYYVYPPGHEVHPLQDKSQFLGYFAGRVRFRGLFSSFRPSFFGRGATKMVANVFEEKSAPQTKSWLRLWRVHPRDRAGVLLFRKLGTSGDSGR